MSLLSLLLCPTLLTRLPSILPDSQVVVTKVTADYDRWALLKSNEPLIVQLQARLRGAKCRKAFTSRVDYLKAHEEQAVKLQVHVYTVCILLYMYIHDVHCHRDKAAHRYTYL